MAFLNPLQPAWGQVSPFAAQVPDNEQKYAIPRQAIYAYLSALPALPSPALPSPPLSTAANGQYNPQVVNAFAECFRGVEILNHPPILWALFPKVPQTGAVQASVFVHYLRYYHVYLALLITQRLPTRLLSDDDLLFLAAIAALGWRLGTERVEKEPQSVPGLYITENTFYQFFGDNTPNLFSLYNCLQLLFQLWPLWDTIPYRIIGFTTANIAAKLLQQRPAGSFLLRFSSEGGFAVDFVRSMGFNNKIEKTRWDPADLTGPKGFMEKLYLGGSADLLKYVVDTTNSTTLWSQATWAKELVFPLSLADVGYLVTDGFQTQMDVFMTNGYENITFMRF